MTPRFLRTALPGLLSALVVAGCGGSGSPHQGTTAAATPAGATTPAIASPQVQGKLTRRRYIRVADNVCTRLKQIATAGNQAVDQALAANQPAAAAQVIQRFYPSYAQGLVLLEGIRPPIPDRPRMRRLLNVMEAQTRTLPIYARALRSNDRQVLQAVTKVQQRLAAQVAHAAKAYGFKVCGR
jgi:hypothetical protein